MQKDKTRKIQILILVLFAAFNYSSSYAQKIKTENLFIGFNYGEAKQENVPIYNDNYFYKNDYYKLQIRYIWRVKPKVTYSFLAEPSFFKSKYQLLNEGFIKPSRGSDYLEQRKRFSQYREFNEYALNLGILGNFSINDFFSIYGLASVGPMISGEDTERLKKGFAFSDIFAIGSLITHKRIILDFRMLIRHNSNAGLFFPNNGHNSVGFETGISYKIKK